MQYYQEDCLVYHLREEQTSHAMLHFVCLGLATISLLGFIFTGGWVFFLCIIPNVICACYMTRLIEEIEDDIEEYYRTVNNEEYLIKVAEKIVERKLIRMRKEITQ